MSTTYRLVSYFRLDKSAYLFSFFTKDMDDPTRWELIEDYFLGRTADVEELLGVEFSLQ